VSERNQYRSDEIIRTDFDYLKMRRMYFLLLSRFFHNDCIAIEEYCFVEPMICYDETFQYPTILKTFEGRWRHYQYCRMESSHTIVSGSFDTGAGAFKIALVPQLLVIDVLLVLISALVLPILSRLLL
jgi:hypothetical protein